MGGSGIDAYGILDVETGGGLEVEILGWPAMNTGPLTFQWDLTMAAVSWFRIVVLDFFMPFCFCFMQWQRSLPRAASASSAIWAWEGVNGPPVLLAMGVNNTIVWTTAKILYTCCIHIYELTKKLSMTLTMFLAQLPMGIFGRPLRKPLCYISDNIGDIQIIQHLLTDQVISSLL